MDVTRKQFTNIEPGKEFGKGPMNMFTNVPAYPLNLGDEAGRPYARFRQDPNRCFSQLDAGRRGEVARIAFDGSKTTAAALRAFCWSPPTSGPLSMLGGC
jgi:hypothetical protein